MNYLPAIVVVIVALAVVEVGVYFALESGPKAEFEVTSLTLSPAEARVGQAVTVSAAVKNTGDSAGTHEFVLTIDGGEVDAKEVTLAAGETKTVTFTIMKDTEGTFTIGVGGLTKSLNVNPLTPATFEVSNLVVNPSEVEVGNPVSISVTVTNTGDLKGAYTVELKIGGLMENTKEITLSGGTTETVSFTSTKNIAKTYNVSVNELTGTFMVFKLPVPAEFEVSNLVIEPSVVNHADPVNISVKVTNVGELRGTYRVVVMINGISDVEKVVTLNGGETSEVSYIRHGRSGEMCNVSVNGLTGMFRVRDISWWNDDITRTSVTQVWADYTQEHVLVVDGEQTHSYGGYGPYDRVDNLITIKGKKIYGTVPNIKVFEWLAKIDLNTYQVVEFSEITE